MNLCHINTVRPLSNAVARPAEM